MLNQVLLALALVLQFFGCHARCTDNEISTMVRPKFFDTEFSESPYSFSQMDFAMDADASQIAVAGSYYTSYYTGFNSATVATEGSFIYVLDNLYCEIVLDAAIP